MTRKKLTATERKARMAVMTAPKKQPSDKEDKDKIKKENFEDTKKKSREQDIECPP